MYNALHRCLVRPVLWVLFLSSLLLALLMGHPAAHMLGSPASAQTSPAAQLVQEGVVAYQSGDYGDAITLWSQALDTYPADANADRAVVHANLARAYQQIGETQAAIAAWEAAEADYKASDNTTQFGRMMTEQAQVYISLGQHQRAAVLLCGDREVTLSDEGAVGCSGGAYAIALGTEDAIGQTTALGSLAETYRLRGRYETAEAILKMGLELVQANGELSRYQASIFNSLGNTYTRWSQLKQQRAAAAALLDLTDRREGETRRFTSEILQDEATELRGLAVEAFADAIRVAKAQSDALTELRSHLSLVSLYQNEARLDDANATQRPIAVEASTSQARLAQLIRQLPPSRETAYAAISLAQSYRTAEQEFACPDSNDSPVDNRVNRWLSVGLQIANRIEDDRAKSFALGELGHLAECQRDWEEATRLTNLAQAAASNALESADSLYLWEWQMGRIQRDQEQIDNALALYKQAIATLESIRTNILTANRDLQFDFRDTVEPIYRQYIELQLDLATNDGAATKQLVSVSVPNLEETLQTVDALRLAELQNFFGDDCVLVASTNAREQLLADDTQTTVVTSVVLPEYTALIANLPDGTSKIIRVNNSVKLEETPVKLEEIADQYRAALTRFTDRVFNRSFAEVLYQQLVEPLESELERTQTQTLVFVQDGFLRNIPMSALYDGNQYLIQKYAIATTPALSLTAPRSTTRDYQALAVGSGIEVVTESGRSFDDLDSIDAELDAVADKLPGSRTLLNQEFTLDQFKSALQATRYPVLHLATHGQFSTVPEETFVITGPNEAGVAEEITFNQLEALIRLSTSSSEPIELITLTACETATGDDRATLGLAGVAIQAGARSAIASLWKLDDNTAVELIPNFYTYLQAPNLSRAQALQKAQIHAIESNPNGNPGRWSPLVLVGNWQ